MNVKILLCGCALVIATATHVCASDDEDGDGDGMRHASTTFEAVDPVPDNAKPNTLGILKADLEEKMKKIQVNDDDFQIQIRGIFGSIDAILGSHTAQSTTTLTDEQREEANSSFAKLLAATRNAAENAHALGEYLATLNRLLQEISSAHNPVLSATPNKREETGSPLLEGKPAPNDNLILPSLSRSGPPFPGAPTIEELIAASGEGSASPVVDPLAPRNSSLRGTPNSQEGSQ